MWYEVQNIYRDAGINATYGVNAKLRALDHYKADEPLTPVKSVLTVFHSKEIAEMKVGTRDLPAIVIAQAQPGRVAGVISSNFRDGLIFPVSVLYVTRDRDITQARRMGSYTLRAFMQTLTTLRRQASTVWTQNNVCLLASPDMFLDTEVTEFTADKALVPAELVVHQKVRDNAPE